MFINGSHVSVMQNLVLLFAKYLFLLRYLFIRISSVLFHFRFGKHDFIREQFSLSLHNSDAPNLEHPIEEKIFFIIFVKST